jgi:cysteine-rich repeat protein
VIDKAEQCDDHNEKAGDGCSSTCQLETCGDGKISSLPISRVQFSWLSSVCTSESAALSIEVNGVPFWKTNLEGPCGCKPEIQQRTVDMRSVPRTFNDGKNLIDLNLQGSGGKLAWFSMRVFGIETQDVVLWDTGSNGDAMAARENLCLAGADRATTGGIRRSTEAVLHLYEECDDGNQVDTDACSALCLNTATKQRVLCGNGRIDGTESCDDGNRRANDGCSVLCVKERSSRFVATSPTAKVQAKRSFHLSFGDCPTCTEIKNTDGKTPGFENAEIAAKAAFPAALREAGRAAEKVGMPRAKEEWDILELQPAAKEDLSPLLVVYSNGSSCAIRLIRRKMNLLKISEGPNDLELSCKSSGLSTIDIDSDGWPEILISFGDDMGREAHALWLFSIGELGELTSIGPTREEHRVALSPGPRSSDLYGYLNTFDLDADGTLELYAYYRGPGETGATLFKRDRNGQFKRWKELRVLHEVRNTLGGVVQETVDLPALGRVNLQILTSLTRSPISRVRSAEVRIDGKVVVPAGSFGAEVPRLLVPINLPNPENSLEIELRGSPEQTMFLLVE